MAKSSKSTDRRAVVEQMRREQQAAERRRTLVIVAACVAIGLVIIGLGAYPLLKQKSAAKGTLASLGTAAGKAGCQDITTAKATGNSDHKQVGEKIFYDQAPPAFGPHYPTTAPMERKFYTTKDRPQVEYLVHNLEHGYNVLWYDQTIADDSDALAVVKGIAGKFDGTDMKDKFIAAPWTAEDGKPFPKGTHVAMTHWSMGGTHGNPKEQLGVWQYCAAPSGEAVDAFVKAYPFTDSPEPGAM